MNATTIKGKEIKIGDNVEIKTAHYTGEAYIISFGERNGETTVSFDYRQGNGWEGAWSYTSECQIIEVYKS